MQPDVQNRLRNLWHAILPIAISALFFGVMFAFRDYVRQYTATWSFSRQISHYIVQVDTKAALIHRFLLGASAGAVIGLLITLRNGATRTIDRP